MMKIQQKKVDMVATLWHKLLEVFFTINVSRQISLKGNRVNTWRGISLTSEARSPIF
jgi:hypothetical protein